MNKLGGSVKFFLMCLLINDTCLADISLVNTTAREINIFIDEVTDHEDDDQPFSHDDDNFCILGPVWWGLKTMPLPVGAVCLVPFAFQGALSFIIETKNPDDLRKCLQFYVKYDKLVDDSTYTVALRRCSIRRQCGEFLCDWRPMPTSWCLQLTTGQGEHELWIIPEENNKLPHVEGE